MFVFKQNMKLVKCHDVDVENDQMVMKIVGTHVANGLFEPYSAQKNYFGKKKNSHFVWTCRPLSIQCWDWYVRRSDGMSSNYQGA